MWLLAVGLACLAGCGRADLSPDTVMKIKLGMTLDEVEQLVGSSARPSRPSDESTVNERAKRFGQPSPAVRQDGLTKYVFRSGDAWLFVDVDDKTGKVAGFNRWASSSGRGLPR